MDARCIRIKKFADTKISGYVWVGPDVRIRKQLQTRVFSALGSETKALQKTQAFTISKDIICLAYRGKMRGLIMSLKISKNIYILMHCIIQQFT